MGIDSLAERALPLVNDIALYPARSTRKRLIDSAWGDVLEVGYGSGVNAQFYTTRVESLVALEPSEPMWSKGIARAAKHGLNATRIDAFVEDIPVSDNSFDTVVSTFVLCSVHSVEQALSEIYRVLRPGGCLLLVEHTQHPGPTVARLQRFVTPVWSRCLAGCHPGRPIEQALAESRFEPEWSETLEFRWLPKVIEHHVCGMWTKPERP